MTTTSPTSPTSPTGPATGVTAPATRLRQRRRRPRRAPVVVGWVLSALVGLFLGFDGVAHVLRPAPVVESAASLGYPVGAMVVVGVVELVALLLFLVPRTAVLGAVLLTGHLGGAVAAQLRVEAPLASTLLFPVYVGVLVWAALLLRDPAARGVLVRRG